MDFDRHFNLFRRQIDSLFEDFDRSFYRDANLLALPDTDMNTSTQGNTKTGENTTAMTTRDNGPNTNVGFFHPRTMIAPRMKVDVIEEPNAYVIQAELPGMNKDDVKVSVDNDVLTISAERKSEIKDEDKNKRYVRMERSYGAVSRSLRLPPGCDPSKINAKHENGVLKITIPRNPNQTSTKAIQIQ